MCKKLNHTNQKPKDDVSKNTEHHIFCMNYTSTKSGSGEGGGLSSWQEWPLLRVESKTIKRGMFSEGVAICGAHFVNYINEDTYRNLISTEICLPFRFVLILP